MSDKIRILFVDDDPGTRALYQLILGSESDMDCVGTLASAEGLAEEVARHAPDVVLLDLRMPGQEPLAALRAASRQRPQTRTIVFSGMDDPALVEEAMATGAAGYLSKDVPPESVLDTIRRVSRGETVITRR